MCEGVREGGLHLVHALTCVEQRILVTDPQTDRQTDSPTDTQIDKQTDYFGYLQDLWIPSKADAGAGSPTPCADG